MIARPGTQPPDGYTLLELLVALTVLAFLLIGLTQGMHFGLLAWRTQVRLAGNTDDFTVVDGVVRHLIEGANPGDDVDPAPFIGTHNQIDCITALPNADLSMPTRRIQARLFVDAGHRLVLRWLPFVHGVRVGTPPQLTDTDLLDGVSRLELVFWGPGGVWTTTWRSPNLPVLVRVRILFGAGDARRWPDIVAAPMLDRP